MNEYKIKETKIKQLKNKQYPYFYLEILDQNDKWHNYKGDFVSLEDVKKIEKIELQKEYINNSYYNFGNRVEYDIDPLIITKTNIERIKNELSDFYSLEVRDQYGRWWGWLGDSSVVEEPTKDELQKIEQYEVKKGNINIDLYYIDDTRLVDNIKRKEAILYVFTKNIGDKDYLGRVRIITIDLLEYVHYKKFSTYENIKNFALKIKEKGIVNLEYWTCIGPYDWESDSYNEFEEEYYYDDSEEREDRNILEMVENDRLPDGTIPGFRD